MALRIEGHIDILTQKLRGAFDDSRIFQVLCNSVHKIETDLRMSHFTTLERDRDFHLAAVIQELHALINFVAVIMIRDIQTELDLFDFLGLLILLLIFQLLFLLVA